MVKKYEKLIQDCIDHIKVVLDEIKGMGKKLAEGPMSHMVKWCNPV